MGNRRHQPGRRPRREPRVGVEGDHITHACWCPVGWDEAGVGGSPEKTVELVKLAPLALPAHVEFLAGVEQTLAMEEQEPIRPSRPRSVSLIELEHAAGRRSQELGVVGQLGPLGVPPVADQREVQIAIRIGQVVDLEPFNQFLDLVGSRQQGRDRNQRAQLWGRSMSQRQ